MCVCVYININSNRYKSGATVAMFLFAEFVFILSRIIFKGRKHKTPNRDILNIALFA